MITAPTYDFIKERISDTELDREMIGIIFAHPEHNIVKEEILPFYNHMDLRSGKHVDFFFAGYTDRVTEDAIDRVTDYAIYREIADAVEIEMAFGGGSIFFSEKLFLDFIKEIESDSKWKRTGGVDFLLLDVVKKKSLIGPELDFSKCIEIELSIAREEKRIPMLSIFFESIFKFSEQASKNKKTWSLSDNQIPSLALTTLESIIPAGLFRLYKNGSIYAVRNLAAKKKKNQTY